jgi:hypothetical protein
LGTIVTAGLLNAHGLPPTILTAVRAVTATGVVQADTDYILLVDCSDGPVTLYLPSISDCYVGRQFICKKTDASANACTLSTYGSEMIDAGVSLDITGQNNAVRLCNAGTGWQTLDQSVSGISTNAVYQSTMTGAESPTFSQGLLTICELDPNGAARNFNPTVPDGHMLVVKNLGNYNIVFDSAGAAQAVGPGQWAFCTYYAPAWSVKVV